MRVSPIDKSFLTRPPVVMVIGVVALGAWGFNFWQQSTVAPIREHIEAGRQLAAQGQLAAAQQEWRRAVQRDPQNMEARLLLSESFLNSKQWLPAFEVLREVEKIDFTTPNLYAQMALCALQTGDIASARRHAQTELARDPNHIEALQLLVAIFERSHEDDKRLEILRRLVQLQPDSVAYLSLLGDTLVARAEYQEARPVLGKILRLNPNAGAYANHGTALLMSGGSPADLEQAARDFEKALELDAGDTQSRLKLAQTYLRLRRPRQAMPHLEALNASPAAAPAAIFELANAHQQLGQTAKSRQLRRRYAMLRRKEYENGVLRSRVAHDPKNFDLHLQLGLSLLQTPQPIDADKYLKAAAALRPGAPSTKAALQRLENLYVSHLNAVTQAINRRDSQTVSYHIAYLMMLLPHDPRTQNARQQVAAAALPPPTSIAPAISAPTASTTLR